jgi:methylglutaconyl-CoA hydratase
MSTSLVDVKVHAPAGTSILNRPDRRNAFTREMLAGVRQALEDLHQELRVRAVIITGAGSAFCAGSDMNEMLETAEQENAIEQYYEDANPS